MSRLVDWLVRERSERVSHGLYYNTQIAMGYNSNHMEGSTLTPEQTAQLFTTGSVLADGPDDIIRAGLDIPEITNVIRELCRRGFDLDPSIYTVEDAVRAIRAYKEGK